MSGYTVRVGRGINYVDLTDNKKICVVGDYISRVVYGGNAVGQTIKIGAEKYTIVGVLEAKMTDPRIRRAAAMISFCCPTPRRCAFQRPAPPAPTPSP